MVWEILKRTYCAVFRFLFLSFVFYIWGFEPVFAEKGWMRTHFGLGGSYGIGAGLIFLCVLVFALLVFAFISVGEKRSGTQCPSCFGEIEEDLGKCPYCNYPLTKGKTDESLKQVREVKTR